jgi:serine phosphatase RsbU (regulator of sigma subunit)/pSer/pThr/pTyr-binding forkhead associated (FHA) protein
MPTAYLIEESDNHGITRVPIGDGLVVGRTSDCGFVIQDAAASRRHMEIALRGKDYTWRDLDSTNGVYVNEQKLTTGTLAPGDKIRIGSTTLVFQFADADGSGEPDTERILLNNEIVRRLQEGDEIERISNADVLLDAVYAVMNAVSSDYDPCGLVDRILQTTIKAIGGQRGAVFFAGEVYRLEPCSICGHIHLIDEGALKRADLDALRISNTAARRVLAAGESLLIRDAANEKDFESTDSIVALALRSIICVPLRGKYGILGILYIDTNRPGAAYTNAHLLLTTAVGNSAGLALENARMHQEILQKQRTDQELAFAANIQEGFLVNEWPQLDDRYQVFGETRPAKLIGGDFYDYLPLPSGRIGLLIGDVSGKGVPAALSMAQILAEFRVNASMEKPPVEVMRSMNVAMCARTQRGMFCTVYYAVFDPATGEVVCANAGHHPALCVRRHGTDVLGPPTGPPIGIFEDATWEEGRYRLEPADTLILYTDGIVEARGGSPSKMPESGVEEYGIDSLRGLSEDLRGEAPGIVVGEILRDVTRYCEPLTPHDDCTLLAMRRTG